MQKTAAWALPTPRFLYTASVYNKFTMLFASIAQDYFRWHYYTAFQEMFHLWLNFLWFIIHFFSISQLVRAWFAPWKRMTEGRGDTWNFEDFAGYILINILSRFIGALLRTIIICTGLFVLSVLIVFGGLTFIFWVAAPAFIILFIAVGITLMVTNLM